MYKKLVIIDIVDYFLITFLINLRFVYLVYLVYFFCSSIYILSTKIINYITFLFLLSLNKQYINLINTNQYESFT